MVKSLKGLKQPLSRSETFSIDNLNSYKIYQGVMNIMMRDRFELLSAYLDGEVTPSERSQVEEWLKTDEELRCLYHRLLRLRSGLQEIPIPVSSQSSEDVIRSVFQRIDQEQDERKLWRGGAIAALLIGTVSGIGLVFNGSLNPELAQTPELSTSEEVAIAINEPIMEIVFPNVPIDDAVLMINQPVIEIPKP